MAEAAYQPFATLFCVTLAAAGSRRRHKPEEWNPYAEPRPPKLMTPTEFFRGIAAPGGTGETHDPSSQHPHDLNRQ